MPAADIAVTRAGTDRIDDWAGITGVPFAVFNGTHAVAGATSVRGYAAAIAQTLGGSA